MYVYGLPICHECAKAIAQSGISKVVLPLPAINTHDKWRESWAVSEQIFDECGINVMLRFNDE